jgi:hypothetical protein
VVDVSQTPGSVSKGLEVKPLTRKELEEIEVAMGEAYVSMIISIYQLNRVITSLQLVEVVEVLELERIKKKLEEVSKDLVTIARDLVRKLAQTSDQG